jgi:hypothetical protein
VDGIVGFVEQANQQLSLHIRILFIMNHGNAFKMHKVVAFRIYVKKDLWLKELLHHLVEETIL